MNPRIRPARAAHLGIQDKRHVLGMVTIAQFAAMRQQTTRLVEKDLAAGRLFAMEMDGQHWILAAFANPSIDKRRLARLCRVLQEAPAGARLRFLTTPKGSLSGRTPLEALIAGSWGDVVTAARGYMDR